LEGFLKRKETSNADRYPILGLDDPVAVIWSGMVAFTSDYWQLWMDRQRLVPMVFALPARMGQLRIYSTGALIRAVARAAFNAARMISTKKLTSLRYRPTLNQAS
jgi:hypothetical protein